MNEIITQEGNTCITCGTELTGNYCSQCGEKKLIPLKDYSIGKFLEQTIDGFTHFDSKFLRSFQALLFKPGLLTDEFIKGRRMRYMKPVQIFIIGSVLFYFFFPKASTFFATVHQLEVGGKFNLDVTKTVQSRAKSDSTTIHLVIKNVEREAAYKSKAYLFLLIPFWGIFFYLIFRKSISFLVPHIIFSIHNLSFLVVLFMIYYSTLIILRVTNISDKELIPMALIYVTYLFFAIRKVYHQNIFWSLLKSFASFALLLVLFIIYREGITIWTLLS